MKVKNNTKINVPIIEIGRVLRPNEVCDLPFEVAIKYKKYLYPLAVDPASIQKPAAKPLNVQNYKEAAKNNLTKEVDILAASKKTVISSLEDLQQIASSEGLLNTTTIEVDKSEEIVVLDEKVKDVLVQTLPNVVEEVDESEETKVDEIVDVTEPEVDSQLGEVAFETFFGVDGYTSEQIEYVSKYKARGNKRLASELNITEESVAEIRTIIK